jgi:cytochrome c556
MKKSIGLLVASLLLSGAVFTSCKYNAEKVEDSKEDVVDTNENKMDAHQNMIETKYENALDYELFKADTKQIIAENEARIVQFTAKLKAISVENQKMYEEKVVIMKNKNEQLEADIDDFKDGASENWNDFKNRIKKSKNDIKTDIEYYKRAHNY